MSTRSWQRMVSACAATFALSGGLVGLAAVGSPAGAAVSHTTLTVSPTTVAFPDTTLGDATQQQFNVTNNTGSEQTLTFFESSGASPNDFTVFPDGTSDCPDFDIATGTVNLADGNSCVFDMLFFPSALGTRSATITLTDNGTAVAGTSVNATGDGAIGYYQVASDGSIGVAGDANDFGDLSSQSLNSPIVGMAQVGNNGGYWLVAADGGIFGFGPDAGFHGSAGGLRLNKPIVGMAAPPSESSLNGYWQVATDGGIFSYGDVQFYGSTGGMTLNKPIVGMASTTDGGGYWLVASDGGIFAYGDAQFYGSTGSIHLNQPIVGMAPTPDDGGYWLVAADGGIFAYGDAQFYGSTGSLHLDAAHRRHGRDARWPGATGLPPPTAVSSTTEMRRSTAAGSSIGLTDVVGMATDGAGDRPGAATAGRSPSCRSSDTHASSWQSPLPRGQLEVHAH